MVQFISLASVYLLWGLAKRKSFLSYDIMTTDSRRQIPDKIADIIKGARWRWGNGSLNDAWCHSFRNSYATFLRLARQG